MLQPSIKRNDRLAKRLIITVSVLIFLAVLLLDGKRFRPEFPFSFDVHYFAAFNAVINTIVCFCLVLALWAVRLKKYALHRNLMVTALILSVLFLVSYIGHHLFAGDTRYGGEGAVRYLYYFILITHIILAAGFLPFILFTAYRGLSGDYPRHKKLARFTWPLWFYVSVTGVIIYLMISPYYG